MADERSDLERRLDEVAEGLGGSGYHWDHERADVVREAAEAIGEARRHLEIFEGSSCPCCSCESARAALARLKGAEESLVPDDQPEHLSQATETT